jgi:23S rRNA pseudouridine2605 synthase
LKSRKPDSDSVNKPEANNLDKPTRPRSTKPSAGSIYGVGEGSALAYGSIRESKSEGGGRNTEERRETRGKSGAGKPSRFDKPARDADKPSRFDKPARDADRPSRFDKLARDADKPSRFDKPARDADRPSRFDKPARGADRPSRFDKSGSGADRPSRFDKPARGAGKPSRFDKPARGADRPSRFDNNDRDEFTLVDRPGKGRRPSTTPARRPAASPEFDLTPSDGPARPPRKPAPPRNSNLPPKRIDRHSPDKQEFSPQSMSAKENSWRLNKYIANAGVCSRREADDMIAAGRVQVNGETVIELGMKVARRDRVLVDGNAVNPVDFVYILLNKPKNYITTTDDEKGRNTVMELVEDATGHRVYPVGRLDRQTTGLLLLTNDGDLANRLMHPSYKVRKVYEVQTAEPITDEQFKALKGEVQLEDGPAKAHDVKRVTGYPNHIQITIFEGRNRQVRRMMEAVGCPSVELVRTTYGGLHIRGIRNGRWRYLSPTEVNNLRTLVELFTITEKPSSSSRGNKASRLGKSQKQ